MANLRDLERATGLNVVTREEWGAREPRWEPPAWRAPCDNVWVHHAAVEGSDDADEMRQHQDFHQLTKGWSDIFYNLAIPDPNPDRLVFEGRGLFRTAEDVDWAEILVMGNFEVDKPSEGTLDVLATVLRYGIDVGWWRNNIAGHRDKPGDQGETRCPGRHLYARLPDVRDLVNAGPTEEDWLDMATEKQVRTIIRQELKPVIWLATAAYEAAASRQPAETVADAAFLFEQFGVEEGETLIEAVQRQFAED